MGEAAPATVAGRDEVAPTAVNPGEDGTPNRSPARRWRGRLARRLAAPLASTGLLYAVSAAGDVVPAVDTLAYLEAGRSLLDGDGFTRFGEPELHFPPLVPLALGLLERLTGSEMAALGTWNVLTGLAVVVALAAIAHRVWLDDTVTVTTAWLAGAMTGLGPLFFRHGSGSEAPSLALLLAAVALAPATTFTRAGGRPGRPGRAAGAGALVGLAYLTRPELLLPGLLLGLGLGVGAAVAARGPTRAAAAALVTVTLFLGGTAVFVGPYVTYLHSHTGTWSLTSKSQDVSIGAWRSVAEGDRRARDAEVYALTADGTRLRAEARPLIQLAAEDPAAWAGIAGVNARTIGELYLLPGRDGSAGWALVPAPLAALGAAEMWRSRRRLTIWLLAGIGLVPIVTCTVFFALPRYLALPTAVLTLLTAAGLVRWGRRLPPSRAWACGAVAVLLVGSSSVAELRPFLPGGRTADPVSHHDAGAWLADSAPPAARVMTRSFHVQAYAHRPVVALPVASYAATMRFARLMGVTYLVVDPRSPLYGPLTRSDHPPGLQLVATFGPPHRAVLIYRLDPPPPPSDRDPEPLGYVGD